MNFWSRNGEFEICTKPYNTALDSTRIQHTVFYSIYNKNAEILELNHRVWNENQRIWNKNLRIWNQRIQKYECIAETKLKNLKD